MRPAELEARIGRPPQDATAPVAARDAAVGIPYDVASGTTPSGPFDPVKLFPFI